MLAVLSALAAVAVDCLAVALAQAADALLLAVLRASLLELLPLAVVVVVVEDVCSSSL